ncbi:Catabolite control protein B [compost metagenome]
MANIKQIAEAAGVSVTTVSRVLNQHPYVSESKRQAVEEAIERLQYSRNMNAVHLIKGHTQTIGVILPQINHPYFSQMIEGIAKRALEFNYQLMLCQTNYQLDEEIKVLKMLRDKQLDGVIICSRSIALDHIEAYTSYGPIVLCEAVQNSPMSSVYLDHYASFQKAIHYLWDKGHHDIGFTLYRHNSSNSLKRKQAYMDTLQALGGQPRQEWIVMDQIGIEGGDKLVKWFIQLEEKPSALLITGDDLAAGFLIAAWQHGLRIPQDIAIIGFDNQPIAKALNITTIETKLHEIGSRAFEIAHQQIIGEQDGPVTEELSFSLIERGTV